MATQCAAAVKGFSFFSFFFFFSKTFTGFGRKIEIREIKLRRANDKLQRCEHSAAILYRDLWIRSLSKHQRISFVLYVSYHKFWDRRREG